MKHTFEWTQLWFLIPHLNVSFYSCFRAELTNTSAALFSVAGSDCYRHQTAHNTAHASALTTSAARLEDGAELAADQQAGQEPKHQHVQ